MSEPQFFLIVVGAAVALGIAGAVRIKRWQAEDAPAPELPTLFPGNAPLVAVLRVVAADVEESGRRAADGLRDIARVIQVSATEEVSAGHRTRIAGFVKDHASVLQRGAQRIDEGV
jgi:hypothetical protein